jgi:hypothetical protein
VEAVGFKQNSEQAKEAGLVHWKHYVRTVPFARRHTYTCASPKIVGFKTCRTSTKLFGIGELHLGSYLDQGKWCVGTDLGC